MSKRPWMPLYIGDYLGDTGHLNTTQHGAYLLMLMHYWSKGSLPDDDKQLAKITRLPLKIWLDQRETIQAFFHDGWKSARLEAELHKMIEIKEKRAAAGQKGGFWSAIASQKRRGNGSLSNRVYPAANAILEDAKEAAIVHHSHSHKNITPTENVERGPAKGSKFSASPELEAIIAKAKAQ